MTQIIKEVIRMKEIDFFVSYSHEDKDKVESIITSLESLGAKCWYAPRDVVGSYPSAIVDAISHAKFFLLCLSKDSATSNHVLNELEMAYQALRGGLLIEPLCLKLLDIDDPMYNEIMYYIRRINFITPADTASPETIAQEIIHKTAKCFNINNLNTKKERVQSKYYINEQEIARLTLQNDLLKRFDSDVYQQVFSEYDNPDILDIGCGNGDMLFDRLNDYCSEFRLIGVERNETQVNEANLKYGGAKNLFIVSDVEAAEFIGVLADNMSKLQIEKFDIINISMLLLHLKSGDSLLRKLRPLLKPNGTVIIRDIDDGINYAYPDDGNMFERIYEICANNEPSGERRNGRQIYTNLYRAGFRRIELKKSGFTTIGLNYDEKEAFWNMYFQFVLDDTRWMHEKYPENVDIADDLNWYENNYANIFEAFMKDDFVFSLGFQIYVAQK